MTIADIDAQIQLLLGQLDGTRSETIQHGDQVYSRQADSADDIARQISILQQQRSLMTAATQRNPTCSLARFSKG